MSSKERVLNNNRAAAKQQLWQRDSQPVDKPAPQTPPASAIGQVRTAPSLLNSQSMRQLQRTIGNRAVGRLRARMMQRQTAPAKLDIDSGADTDVRAPDESQAARQDDEATGRHQEDSSNGLPSPLKRGIEQLSGIDMSDVRVRYNSSQPVQLQALAYAQGTDIHLGPGQEQHLPHEAWHVVQQMQGRVASTIQMKGRGINDDPQLEREAHMQGQEALRLGAGHSHTPQGQLQLGRPVATDAPVQRLTGFEVESWIPIYNNLNSGEDFVSENHRNEWSNEIGFFLFGGLKYGLTYGFDPQEHFSMTADHNTLQLPHRRLLQTLILSGLLKPVAAARSLANLEYVTPARDETSTAVAALFERDIARVREHANQTIGLAQSGDVQPVPLAEQAVLTGIPKTKILAWIKANGGELSLFSSIIEEMERLITQNLYIQKTTGVLPEDIPEFYARASEQMATGESKDGQLMAEILTMSNKMANDTYAAAFTEEAPPEFQTHKGAVIGYLSYLSTHLLVDSLSLTNFSNDQSTAKNLFPFFPKVSFSKSFEALPEALRGQSEQDNWLKIVEHLIQTALPFGLAYWEQREGIKVRKEKDKEQSDIFGEFNWQTSLQYNADERSLYNADKRSSTRGKLEDLVQGEDISIGVEKNFLDLDTPHSSILQVTGQKAIPMEDRYFAAKYKQGLTTKNFDTALREEYTEAVNRNLKKVPKYQVSEMVNNVIAPVDDYQLLLERVRTKFTKLTEGYEKIPKGISTMEEAILEQQHLLEEAMQQMPQFEEESKKISDMVSELAIVKEEMLSQASILIKDITTLSQKKKGLQQNISSQESEDSNEVSQSIEQQHILKNQQFDKLEQDINNLNKEIAILAKQKTEKENNIKFHKEYIYELENGIFESKQTIDKMRKIELEMKTVMSDIGNLNIEFSDIQIGEKVEHILNQKTLYMHHIANAMEHAVVPLPDNEGFRLAKSGLKEALGVEKAHKARSSIKLDDLESGAQIEIGGLLKDAEQFDGILMAFEELKPETVTPETTSGFLREYIAAAEQYYKIIQSAMKIYHQKKQQ